MVIFHSYVSLPEGIVYDQSLSSGPESKNMTCSPRCLCKFHLRKKMVETWSEETEGHLKESLLQTLWVSQPTKWTDIGSRLWLFNISYWKLPFIVDFRIHSMVIFHCKRLPEGRLYQYRRCKTVTGSRSAVWNIVEIPHGVEPVCLWFTLW